VKAIESLGGPTEAVDARDVVLLSERCPVTSLNFDEAFKRLTENQPFPWQRDLYENWFSQGKFPDACTLPTGLGKTAVIAVWLIALANAPDRVPRRLVYVVNRRTVVDQTTDEVENYVERKVPGIPVFAASTLRGQFADNREWSADPSRPAVICGTVDMIGSRLLFSGYGCGFKSRPLHAGFLGQDALLVHDEAHLEKPFQDLLVAIACEQRDGRLDDQQRGVGPDQGRMDFKPLRVMALTATPRGGEKVFELTPDEKAGKVEKVRERLEAKKRVAVHRAGAEKGGVAKRIGDLAAAYKDDRKSVLVFVRTLEDVGTVEGALAKTKRPVLLLTGTIRGKERDDLARRPEFGRFKKDAGPGETIYLVCTSAGEVGVDISADHLVCDLTPFDSMAQRFGRVNRYGSGDARIDVVCESEPDKKKADDGYEQARWATLELLQTLPLIDGRRDASPKALGALPADRKLAAFTPTPTVLPTSDILFDAWALTTIRDRLPGRPHVEPYLHGLTAHDPPETHVVWRREVEELRLESEDGDTDDDRREKRKAFEKFAAEVLEDYPVEPLELLRDRSDRVFKHLAALAGRTPRLPVWLLDDDGGVRVLSLGGLGDKDQKDRINGMTVLLPPSAGGLSGGRLDGTAKYDEGRTDYDVADEWKGPGGEVMRRRAKGEVKVEKGWRLVRSAVLRESEDGEPQDVFRWLVRRAATDEAGAAGQAGPYPLALHNTDAGEIAADMVKRLNLPDDVAAAVRVAAGAHDLGKDRDTWQRSIGNGPPKPRLAKSGHRRPPEQVTHYRHEFGSLLDVENDPAFQKLSPDMKELALHLIAAHHGRARPHFPAEEAFDPERPLDRAERLAAAVPQRFARLQRKYGRWGLAYLESLVRAADVLASKKAEGGGA
jgi:CRISPR-associated endonuclease/helicase Cas3